MSSPIFSFVKDKRTHSFNLLHITSITARTRTHEGQLIFDLEIFSIGALRLILSWPGDTRPEGEDTWDALLNHWKRATKDLC